MPVTLDAASNIGVNTGTPVSVSHAVGAGSNRFLAACVLVNGEDCSGVTYGGVAMTLKRRYTGSDGVRRREIWGLIAPAVGTANIVATAPTNQEIAVCGTSFFGVDQTTPFGTEGVNNNQTTFEAVSQSVTSTGMAIDCIGTGAIATSLTANGGQTQVRTLNGSNFDMGASIKTGSGSVSMGWSWTTGAGNGIVVAPINEAPPAPEPFVKLEIRAAP